MFIEYENKLRCVYCFSAEAFAQKGLCVRTPTSLEINFYDVTIVIEKHIIYIGLLIVIMKGPS